MSITRALVAAKHKRRDPGSSGIDCTERASGGAVSTQAAGQRPGRTHGCDQADLGRASARMCVGGSPTTRTNPIGDGRRPSARDQPPRGFGRERVVPLGIARPKGRQRAASAPSASSRSNATCGGNSAGMLCRVGAKLASNPTRRSVQLASTIIASLGRRTGSSAWRRAPASMHGPKAEQVKRGSRPRRSTPRDRPARRSARISPTPARPNVRRRPTGCRPAGSAPIATLRRRWGCAARRPGRMPARMPLGCEQREAGVATLERSARIDDVAVDDDSGPGAPHALETRGTRFFSSVRIVCNACLLLPSADVCILPRERGRGASARKDAVSCGALRTPFLRSGFVRSSSSQ